MNLVVHHILKFDESDMFVTFYLGKWEDFELASNYFLNPLFIPALLER